MPESRPLPVGRFDGIIDALWENIRWGKVLDSQLRRGEPGTHYGGGLDDVVGCKNIDAALADIGKMRPVEPSPVLLRSVKRALR